MIDDSKGQTKRISLTSRASKIPQRVSSFLRPSNSTLTTSTSTTTTITNADNEKLSTRLGHILWRQRQQDQQQQQQQQQQQITDDDNKKNSLIKKDLIITEQEDNLEPISPVSLTDSSTTNSSNNHFSSVITAHSNAQYKLNYMMNTPSLIEYADDFTERCARLLCLDDIEFTHAPVLEMLLESAQVLVQACDTSVSQRNALQKSFDQIQCNIQAISKTPGPKTEFLKQEIEKLQVLCQNCLTLNSNSPCLCTTFDLFRKESPKIVLIQPDYDKCDEIDSHANWFRHHFVGKPYITLIGSIPPELKSHPPTVIISVIQERAKDFGNIKENQYRIIIRNQETSQSRFIVHESIIKETISTKELFEKPQEPPKRLRSLRSIQTPSQSADSRHRSRLLRAALLSVCSGLDLSTFKELSAESTILSGLEKDILKYDEIQTPKHYKFGVLMIKEGQTTEEQWFSNTGLTKPLEEFLNIMGQSIELKGYKGYAAGLDTKTGESGARSYKSSWNDQDIIFHVAPLMPSPFSSDKQHIFRKKHIGNDIVCIIFIQGNQIFNPKAIRSQFLHIYIIVRPEIANGKRQWRVEVIRNKNVNNFGPVLPSPPVFDNPDQLKAFLTLKLISAENAALKSKKFFIPNNKARQSILAGLIQTGFNFVAPEILRSVSTTRLSTDSKGQSNNKNLKLQRPRSFNNKQSSSRMEAGQPLVIPPIPTVSRSTLLQDFKKGFSRKKGEFGTVK